MYAELPMQEDRRHGSSAPQVQNTHAGLQVERFAQPFGEPQRIGSTTGAPQHPLGMIRGGARKRSDNKRMSFIDTNCPCGKAAAGPADSDFRLSPKQRLGEITDARTRVIRIGSRDIAMFRRDYL